MQLYRTTQGNILYHQEQYFLLPEKDWDRLINRERLADFLLDIIARVRPDALLAGHTKNELLPPIADQEVWASGVTYLRSREARMEESKGAGGGDFYARVYEAERPELFFKAPGYRVAGPGSEVRIRRDSKWNVPEPELTLFMCTAGTIEGYTIGNDMSSRDIEGENPLYLPQAKSYDGSAALGPCLYVPGQPIDPATQIEIRISRDSHIVFSGSIGIDRMKRSHTELASWLFREMSFDRGAFLMTGTGVVPPDHFTLAAGDEITITIDHIGTLTNTVAINTK